MPTTENTKTDLISTLTDLVKFPTLTGDLATSKAAIDWVKYQLRDLPLIVHDYESNGLPSVVFTTRKTKHPKVLLVAHIDVIPAPADMFEVKERDGRLFGRGVFDMKLAIAAYMQTLLELGDSLKNYDLGVMITSDEELAGDNGVGYLVGQHGWRADVVINPDAIGDWQIEQQAKGFARYELVSSGVAGHGSRPWTAQNAIQPLIACLQEIAAKFQTEPCGDPAHSHNTINMGIISGGVAVNQIPDQARAELDIRYLPSQTADDITALVQEVAARYPGITTRLSWSGPGISVDADNEYVRLFDLLITKVAGVKPKYTLSHGGSDNRFFAAHGIPTISTGPHGGGHHSDNEWVDIKGAHQLARIVGQFVREAAKAE